MTTVKTMTASAMTLVVLMAAGCGKDGSGSVPPVVTEIRTVLNDGLALELRFWGPWSLPGGERQSWTEARQQPYVEAAQTWLSALMSVDGKRFHTLIMNIRVAPLQDANGMAGPDAEERVGDHYLPTEGTLTIGQHTYAPGFDPVEFNANIVHEMGHILGIGSFTEDYTVDNSACCGKAFSVVNGQAAQRYSELYGGHYRVVPISDDGGHLYDDHWQEDQRRWLPSGEPLPPLTKEVMANGTVLGAVTLGVLDDIGYHVNYLAAQAYTP